jgi:hypothetical protein
MTSLLARILHPKPRRISLRRLPAHLRRDIGLIDTQPRQCEPTWQGSAEPRFR